MLDRVVTIAIVVIVVFGLWQERERLSRELKEERATVEGLREEAKAAAVGRAVAEASKERVREIVRTVTLPPTGVACAADPAVAGAYDLVRRMRAAAEAEPAEGSIGGGDQPPRGSVSNAAPHR